MKHKLASFTEFVNQLYPHEADYLLNINQFVKPVNISILKIIHHNCHHPENAQAFDEKIDKRTYSYLKNWIVETLEKADVDKFYEWLLETEKLVMLDAISADGEREIISKFKLITPSHYYFLRFYELTQHFRDYLLIRVRNIFYKPTNTYLELHEQAYIKGVATNKKLNSATVEIIRQHETPQLQQSAFSDFLHQTFSDTTLDGYSRYRAAVRLTFHYYNFREFVNLRSLYDSLDEDFKQNTFYSKRLLSNYYSNRAMMHSKLNELNKAEHYGFLSIRQKNSDYLFYLANLCGVLLRNKKYEKALKIMSFSIPDLKNTNSFYNKIGFVSFYIKTLVYNNKAKNAVSYAGTFLDAYKKEIFDTRWHLFFSAFFHALLNAEKYAKIIANCHRYNLLAKENKFIESSVYTPILFWYYEAAMFIEGRQSRENLLQTIKESSLKLISNNYKTGKLFEILDQLKDCIPAETEEIRSFILKYKEPKPIS